MNNTDFKPLENESAIIEEATRALRGKRLKDCRRLAEPIFAHYHKHNRELTPELTRLFAVYVALGNGQPEALKLLDAPFSPP